MDSGRVAYRCLKRGCIMRGRGRFWECRIEMFKRGVYYVREGYIMGASHTYV